MKEIDCLVVGAGPVGLAMACQLKTQGLNVRIIDKLPQPVIRTKAAGIWSRTLEMLDGMGLAEKFLQAGLVSHGASIFIEGKRVAHLSLDQLQSHFNYILMLPQNETERLLTEQLEALHVPLERGKELESLKQDESGVTVTVAGEEPFRACWVVGCDGAHSTVRHSLEVEFKGKKEPHNWIVADLVLKGLNLADEILIYVHEEGPLALFPMGCDLYRVVAEVELGEDDARRATTKAIEHRAPEHVTIAEYRDTGFFTIHERQVDSYREGRVFLAGDAAHVHSPLGGQGMNTGLQDTLNLAWKLGMVCRGEADASLLDSYHAERHPVARNVIQKTSFGTHMITLRHPVARHLRNHLMKIVTNLPPAQQKARTAMSELDIHYRKSPLSQESSGRVRCWLFGKGVAAGDRAPDGPVTNPDGEETRLHPYLSTTRLTLLLFSSDHEDWFVFEGLANRVRAEHAGLIELIWVGSEPRGSGGPPAAEKYLFDYHGELHHAYAATDAVYYLIRPDGYVACRDLAGHTDTLEGWLQRHTRTTATL